ncbi:MAG: hypothetical protein VX346_08090 [Planctomycetota bacterium]|nr:hypothetical protein [Planctomycetota bacterium]
MKRFLRQQFPHPHQEVTQEKHRVVLGRAPIDRNDLLQHSYNVPMRKQRIWLGK